MPRSSANTTAQILNTSKLQTVLQPKTTPTTTTRERPYAKRGVWDFCDIQTETERPWARQDLGLEGKSRDRQRMGNMVALN